MKKALLLAPLVPMLTMGDASAACSSTIENTSNTSTTTLAANSSNTCLINSGTITVGSSSGPAIFVDGWPSGFSGVSITNDGNISSSYTGIGVDSGSSVYQFRNNGSINVQSVAGGNLAPAGVFLDYGIANGVNVYSSIRNFSNYGTINVIGSGNGASGFSNSGGTVDYFNNYGAITAEDTGFGAAGIINQAGQTISNLTNNGAISATNNGGVSYGIVNQGILPSLVNSGAGTISGGTSGVYNYSTGSITTLTNQGIISSGTGASDIKNEGTITTLNNAQNGLTYTGTLPTNYNVILNSTASFGRLVGTNVTGSAIFGLSNLSSWTPSNYTFTGILQGLTASNIASSSLTGNFGGYRWSLLLENGSSTVWDLKFESTAIGAGSTGSLSNGSGSSPITVAGGTLEATSNSTITAPITLTGSSNSTINASGKTTVFSSAITSSGSGKLVLSDSTGSGAITLNSQNNVIAGGVALASGTLAVGDGSNPNAKLQADVALSPSSTLKGHGTIVGAVTNNGGTVRPGGSIGTLAVSGSYDQSASSTLSIEINPSQNSQLSVYGTLGKANLGGTLEIVATAGSYAPKKYTMVTTTGGVVGSFSNITNNLSAYSDLYSAVSYDPQNVYFTIYGFTLADTQASIVQTHSRLVNLFDYQTMMLGNSLQADCPMFDKNGGCVSISGRYSNATSTSNSIASESGTLTAAFKLNDNLRVGAYVDQTVSEQTLYGIKVNNTVPTFGLFGVWAPTPGTAGLSLRASAGWGSKNLQITRPTVGTSEAGMGSSSLVTKGVRAVVGYDVPINSGLTIAPYLGARNSRQELGGYTESATTTVTAPLSYASLVLDRAAAIGGSRLSGKLDQSVGFFTDLGVEYDFRSAGGVLKTSIGDGLTPVAMGPSDKKIRPVASVGFYHDIAKNQRVSFSANYRMEQFQSTGSASTMLTYAVGFGESRGAQLDNQVTNSLPSSQKSIGEVSGVKPSGEDLITSSIDEKSSGDLKDNKRTGKSARTSANDAVLEHSRKKDAEPLSKANLILPIPRPVATASPSATAALGSAAVKSSTAVPASSVTASLAATPKTKDLSPAVERPVETVTPPAVKAVSDSAAAKSPTADPMPKVTASLAANSKPRDLTPPTPKAEPTSPPATTTATRPAATNAPLAEPAPQVTASLTANTNNKDLTQPPPRPAPVSPPAATTAARPAAANPSIVAPAPQMTASLAVNPKSIEQPDPDKRCVQQTEAVRLEHLKAMSALSSKGLGNYNRQTQKCSALVTFIPMGNPSVLFVETLLDPETNTVLAKIEHRKDSGSIGVINDKGYKGSGVPKLEEVKSYIDQKMDGKR